MECFGQEEDQENLRCLLSAGQQFLFRIPSRPPSTIVVYPWFQDWGRGILISLSNYSLL
ncbi:hypothetical cytosolic protein [Syntrophus aciditrophicus SB]|uniref:Hypothetical cytosolic protein n=1 Tax=Syntrophus aciditrophicus (strain SB) TaxID=56780 RepID=Q2LRL1_SYNAS|nr:hypothetical cytosolic protein [Syntrophus aciditrophicus SB]